jgi:dihydrofolate synthase/folylpolyglutamate synthase
MKNKFKFKFIHVAGTNGKGSTCAFIAHGLIKAGYKTARFTSPHLFDINERITVNDKPIDNHRIPDLPHDRYFITLWETALSYFEECNVDYAVIETGIGGLLDCTNVITPVVSVITKIGFDHMDLLGDSIEKIAAHKAGIIKPGVPVVTDPTQLPQAMRVIRETARLNNAQLFIPQNSSENPFECNKIVANETLSLLGVKGVNNPPLPPGRMQTVCEKPLIIVDSAHNADAIRAVAGLLPQSPQMTVVFGMLKSKDYYACLKELPAHQCLITVENVQDENEVFAAIKAAKKTNNMIFVCGSVYLAANVLKLF